MMINNNLINSSFKNNVKKFLFLGSSCIYPKKLYNQSKKNIYSSSLEPTNLPYAISKISGIVYCQSLNRQFKKKQSIIVLCLQIYMAKGIILIKQIVM